MEGKKNTLVRLACGFVLAFTLIIGQVTADNMTWEDGTNRLGNDYDSLVPGSPGYDGSAESCRDYCLDHPECKAATYVEIDQSCWLKETVPEATPEDGMVSFVRVTSQPTGTPTVTTPATAQATPSATTTVTAEKMTWEDGTNRLGNDYDSLVPGSPGYDGSAESCRDYCLDHPECKAATYVESDQSCWLKEIVPPATPEDGMTSFVRAIASPTGTLTVATPATAQGTPAATAPVTSAVTASVTSLATTPVTQPATLPSPGFELVFSLLGCLIVLVVRRSLR